jgi:lipopolysaccharide transport system permease protein
MHQIFKDFAHLPKTLWGHRHLIAQMTRREIATRYQGSLFGLAWTFINPILMLVVYTFVFSVVFKARWGVDENESRADFAIVLFAGMIIFQIFSDALGRAPGLITSNRNYVKKVVFPLEILPLVTLGSALFHALISLLALLTIQLLIKIHLPWTVLLFPLVLLPLILAYLGISWILASLGVFFRDIGQIMGVLTNLLLFTSAIFYPVSALPENYQSILRLNPLVLIITEGRNVLIWKIIPDWTSLGVTFLVSFVIFLSGYWWFQKTRKGFADVI